VELVLALPVVVLVLLLVVQVGLVVRAQILVIDAAREGARAAAVGGSPAAVAAAVRATPGLRPGRLDISTAGGSGTAAAPAATVRVTVRYRTPTDVALVGTLLADPTLTATVAMRGEHADPAPSPGSPDHPNG